LELWQANCSLWSGGSRIRGGAGQGQGRTS
jgi:hypothetical protein